MSDNFKKRQIIFDGGCECNLCIRATRAKNYAMGNFVVADYAASLKSLIPNDPMDKSHVAIEERAEGEKQLVISKRLFDMCPNRREANETASASSNAV